MQRSRSTRTAPRLAIPRAPAVGWAAQFHGDSGLGGVAPIVMPGRVIRVGELRGSVNCVLVAALLVAPSVLAQPLGEIENFNGRRLDDTGWSKVSGTKWKCNDTSNQRWSSSLEGYDSAGFPMYQIKNDWSGLCLDAGSWKPGTGTRVQQWACHRPATANQEWVFQILSANLLGVFISSEATHSSLGLDVANRSTQSGAPIQLWGSNGGDNQTWFCTFSNDCMG